MGRYYRSNIGIELRVFQVSKVTREFRQSFRSGTIEWSPVPGEMLLEGGWVAEIMIETSPDDAERHADTVFKFADALKPFFDFETDQSEYH